MKNILIDIHYLDYVLYKYVEKIANRDTDSQSALYCAEIVEILSSNLKKKGYEMEEEMAVKYAMYLIEQNVIKRYFKEDAEKRFYSVFEAMEKIKEPNTCIREIKNIVIWGYGILTQTVKTTNTLNILKMTEEKYQKILRNIMSKYKTITSKDILFPVTKRKIYHESISNVFYNRVTQLFKDMNIPLMQKEDVLQKHQLEKVEEKEEEILKIIATELISIHNTDDVYNSINLINPINPVQENQIIPENQIISAKGKTIFDITANGQEVAWNDSETEEGEENAESTQSIHKSFIKAREDSMQTTFSGRKARKAWTPAEEEKLVEGVEKHGRRWSKIRDECYLFTHHTVLQLRDKYRNILKKRERDEKKDADIKKEIKDDC